MLSSFHWEKWKVAEFGPPLVLMDRLWDTPCISVHFSAELWGPELGEWLRDMRGTDVHSHSKAYCDVHSESTNFSKYFTLSWFQVHCSSCRKGLWPCPMSELPSGKSRLCRMHIKPWVSCPSLRDGPELTGGLESLSFQNKEIEIQIAAQLATNCGGDSPWIFAPSTLLAVESKSCPTERF